MTEDITRASEPVVDQSGVRFTVFFEVRGPQVFEVSARVLVDVFKARSHHPDDLLAAFTQHQETIASAAKAWHGRAGPGARNLDDALIRTHRVGVR